MKHINLKSIAHTAFTLGFLVLFSCSSDKKDQAATNNSPNIADEVTEEPAAPAASENGVGPVKEVNLGAVDQAMADEGHAIFEEKCTACHKIEERYIGPALHGVTERRKPAWIMNMILNPEVMVQEDPTAKALLAEYMAPMANQHLTEEQARKVLEFLRTQPE